MKKFALLSFAILVSLYSSAQDTKHIKGAKGSYSISGSVSEEDAKVKALAEAKVNALKMAGVSENIKSYDMLFKSEIGSKYEEVFMSEKQSEIRGAIKDYSVIFRKGLDEYNNFTVEAIIDATVILYKTSADPAFSVSIDGIKKGYQSGEKLTYTITASMNCFLNIFNIYDKNAALTYPNYYEKQIMLEGGKPYTFPLNKNIDYPLERTTVEPERNKLIFVFTKDLIPFVKYKGEDQETNFEDVSSWLYSISPDRRTNHFVSFVIY
ncbi:MAG: hypothetical protein EHM93_00975 [Bacteroidales bacterium]|nr:MAG: hypothetical protein EHM93_00975 [Bacteroidales bacterium]